MANRVYGENYPRSKGRDELRQATEEAGGKEEPFSTVVARVRTLARVGEVLQHVCSWGDGYLKLRPDMDGHSVHCTYTWSVGKHRGCYVYVVHSVDCLGEALEILSRKVLEVLDGTRLPTPDKRRERPD